jgi:putative peptide zinc metalloprotease protein
MFQPVASIDRPLVLRLRPDLVAMPVEQSAERTWVFKDPATLEHFQFSAEECALADWLRQPVSIKELQRRFEAEFAPQTISPEAVRDFLSRLHRAGLLIADGPDQGRELLMQMRRDRARRWAMSWSELLSIRFRGFDPDALLTAAYPRLRWLFSLPAILTIAALMLYAASLVVGHVAEFQQRMPELSALFDTRNLVWLLVTIGAVKVLHELGHALACKHFGGEVHELGVMLLVFAPCLYCDVSDVWRLPCKWQRIAVSAAGILVEIVLAALATIVWWHVQPGVIQLIAINTMIVCTIGTLLVNGNPLLRYDGYYILSDLVEIPNLWQRSREVLRRMASEWILGEPPVDDPLIPMRHSWWLASYAAASKLYVTLVCVAIVWGLVELLYPLHLQNLAYVAGFTVLGSAVAGPVSRCLSILRNPIRRAELPTGRLALIGSISLAIAVAVLAMPVTYHVHAPLVLMPEEAARVYATIDGTLEHMLPAGRQVARGQIIGQLANLTVTLELARAEGECRLRRLRVEHLERLRGVDTEANDELPTARAALADAERRLGDWRHEVSRLTLSSPVDGTILAPPRLRAATDASMRLARWSGSLSDSNNIAATVEPGTLVCLIGDPGKHTAMLLVDDVDIKRLRPGQRVRMRFDQLPGHVIHGEVVDVARHEARALESPAAGQADLAVLYAGIVPAGNRSAIYQACVRFDVPGQPLVIGGRGQAKIAAERITRARSIIRLLAQTFRLPM